MASRLKTITILDTSREMTFSKLLKIVILVALARACEDGREVEKTLNSTKMDKLPSNLKQSSK